MMMMRIPSRKLTTKSAHNRSPHIRSNIIPHQLCNEVIAGRPHINIFRVLLQMDMIPFRIMMLLVLLLLHVLFSSPHCPPVIVRRTNDIVPLHYSTQLCRRSLWPDAPLAEFQTDFGEYLLTAAAVWNFTPNAVAGRRLDVAPNPTHRTSTQRSHVCVDRAAADAAAAFVRPLVGGAMRYSR